MDLTEGGTDPQKSEFRRRIRKLHRELRGRMSPEIVREKSLIICERLRQAEWYEACRVIYGYYPLGNEVDCRSFLEQALLDGKAVALPATGSGLIERSSPMERSKLTFGKEVKEAAKKENAHRMEFFRIASIEQVAEGNFHVMEPLAECPVIQDENAIVLVPGVAFDRTGNRYGYGGGYYDRYFSRFPQLYRVALCYENQMEIKLDVNVTDIRMREIYTEQQRYVINP